MPDSQCSWIIIHYPASRNRDIGSPLQYHFYRVQILMLLIRMVSVTNYTGKHVSLGRGRAEVWRVLFKQQKHTTL